MQQEELIITREDQARALQDTGFLGQFVDPTSPSDVARKLGMPANLAHHHAQRHAALGLLEEVKREQGKVYYQLVARTFKHARSLLLAGAPDEHTATTLNRLRERFLIAYERSDRIVGHQDSDWTEYGFMQKEDPQERLMASEAEPVEPRPAHFQVRTLALSPERYRKLVNEIGQLLRSAAHEKGSDAEPCTLAFLAMDGALQAGYEDNHQISSFVPPKVPGSR